MEQRVLGAEDAALKDEIDRLNAEVSRLKEQVAQLDRVACMDTLVPAANRRGLVKALDMVLARSARHGVPAAILFIDVDGLKHINDAHGHGAGDAVLIHLTALMNANVRKTDLVARVGGDEFAVLLDHSDERTAMDAAKRLANTVAESDLLYRGTPLDLGVAIGLAMIEKDDTPESVLDRADQAMYRVKNAA